MAGDPEGGLLGRLAVYYKLITMDQLTQATQAQSRHPGKRLGEIMVGAGWITDQQLQQLLQAQKQYLERARQKREASRPVKVKDVKPVASTPTVSISGGTGLSMSQAVASANMSAKHVLPAKGGTGSVPVIRAPAEEPLDLEPPKQDEPVAAPQAASRTPTPAPAPKPVPARAAAPAAPILASAEPAPKKIDRPARDNRAVDWLNGVLKQSAEVGASDVHLHSNATIKLRRFRQLIEFTQQPLPEQQATSVINSILDDDEYTRLYTAGQVDTVYAIDGVGRFRVNAYRQHRGVNAVFHFVPGSPPSLEELGLPSTLAKVTNFHQGLVLITGPAGCGKSSTLAALVNIINEERHDHILTIEDPVEYIHPTKRCLVNQRQVNTHTKSFARALKAALREDPDVICIGELRDQETISLAMSAAETGHLVLGTLHTSSTIRTINRIVGVYPPSQQSQVRTMLSESLRAVVSQRLLPSIDGDGVALAIELLLINKAVGNLIRENQTFQINSILQTGASKGMKMLDTSLRELVQAGRITKETARANAEKPDQFK